MKSDQVSLKKWYNISEAAKYLSLSQDTLRRWEKKGKLVPRRTMGKHRRYSHSQLREVFSLPVDQKPSNINNLEQNTPSSSPPSREKQPDKHHHPDRFIHRPGKSKFNSHLTSIALIIATLLLFAGSYFLLTLANPSPPAEPLSPLSLSGLTVFFV